MTADAEWATHQVHRALAHPLRPRILAAAAARSISPIELAREFAQPLGTMAYHVRVMARDGLLVADGTSPRRGALQHHYRASPSATVLRFAVARGTAPALVERLRRLADEVGGAAIADGPTTAGGTAGGAATGEYELVEITVLSRDGPATVGD